jgi:uncharacterized protein YbjT (DUF2867 family)
VRVLLTGATGLIGSAVAARLAADGHEILGVARKLDAAARRVAVARWVRLDLRHATRPEHWLPHLSGIDAVINAAGALQASARDSPALVHADAPAALWRACAQAGVRRIIQISAIGVNDAARTDFSRTKAAGDAALAATGLDWVILRPSVVVGGAAYGGSALFRGLASLPVFPHIPEAGPLDVVQLDDVAETVARLLREGAASRVAIDLAGPERLSLAQIVGAYRSWLGWRPAREIRIPAFLLALGWRLGDLAAWLGWRPPIRSTARRELARGAIGDGSAWTSLTGVEPRTLAAALAANPASVQERWFARLYLLKPVAIGTFALFWLLTGIVSLGPGRADAVETMRHVLPAALAGPAAIAGAIADLAIGAAMLFRPMARPAMIAALAVSLSYLLLGSILLPALWTDPLGPLMKILPILALNLLCLAILDER